MYFHHLKISFKHTQFWPNRTPNRSDPIPLNLSHLQKMSFCHCLKLDSYWGSLHSKTGQWQGGREGVGGRGEKWPKHCMHIWINEKKNGQWSPSTFSTPRTILKGHTSFKLPVMLVKQTITQRAATIPSPLESQPCGEGLSSQITSLHSLPQPI
jgi:hypothetical protein